MQRIVTRMSADVHIVNSANSETASVKYEAVRNPCSEIFYIHTGTMWCHFVGLVVSQGGAVIALRESANGAIWFKIFLVEWMEGMAISHL